MWWEKYLGRDADLRGAEVVWMVMLTCWDAETVWIVSDLWGVEMG